MKKSLLFLFMLLTTAGIAFAGDGTKENPYTVEEAVAANIANNTADVWVQGYIVGWNSGAVFAPNVKFSADGAENNNIVLAPSADATSPLIYITNNFISDLSIQNNPDILGKQVAVKGKVATMVNKSWDNISEFYWVSGGGNEGGDTPAPGDGLSAETAFTVAEAIASKGSGYMWIKGYTVGSCQFNSIMDIQCKFGAEDPYASSILLADTKDCTDSEACLKGIYLSTAISAELSLTDHPERLGQYVAVYGSFAYIATFPNSANVQQISQYKILEDPNGGGSEEPKDVEKNTSFDFTTKTYGQTVVSSGNDYPSTGATVKSDFVSLKFDGGNVRLWKDSKDQITLRCYTGTTFTFSVPEGGKITSIKFNITTNLGLADGQSGTLEKGTWTGEAQSVTIKSTKSSGNIEIKTIEIKYTVPADLKQACENPVFTPANGSVVKKNSYVTISCETEGAKIYYTTNGSTPKAGAEGTTEYAAPGVFIDKTTSIKAIAVADGMTDSEVVLASFYVPIPVTSIDEFKTDNTPADYYELKSVMTVTYANGARCFVQDATGSLLLYSDGFRNLGLKNGDQLYGVIGKYATYGGLVPEMDNIVAESISPQSGSTTVAPVEATVKNVAASTMNDYMLLKGVTIAANAKGDKYFDITDASGSVMMYNQFGITITPTAEGETADIIGIPSAYGGEVRFCPIEITINEAPVTGGDVMKEGDGVTAETAYTVAQIIQILTDRPGELTNQVLWIKGYAVGTADGDFMGYTPDFGTENANNNTMVLANTKDCTDITECMVCLLYPNGTDVNLKDHPENLGAVIALRGTVTRYAFGQTINSMTQTAETKILAPAETGGDDNPVEEGDGTEDKPYSVAQVIEKAPENCWFQGYLVGVASGNPVPPTGFTPSFGLTGADVAAYPSRIIADTKDCTDLMKCVVMFNCSNELLNPTKPEQMGKKFKIYGVQAYNFGVAGMVYAIANQVIELTSTGIEAAEVDDNTPVEYYNLQGMPVSADNLRAGQIYVRRQGASVAKILVK